MRFIIAFLFLVLGFAFSEPVQTQITYEGKSLRLNGDLEIPEGVSLQDKPVVLLVHGLFQTHKMREPIGVQREAWLSEGYPVLGITLSLGIDDRKEPYACDRPLDHDYSLNLKEIGVWVKWLKNRGAKKIVLAGHSFGGQQVILFAKDGKDRALVGVMALAPAKGLKREHPLLEKARRLVQEGKGKTLLRTNFFYCKEAQVSARTLWSYYGEDRNIGKALDNISLPTLVVVAALDERVSELDKFLEPYVKKNERVEVKVIDFADHFFRDLAAEDLGAITLDFLKRF